MASATIGSGGRESAPTSFFVGGTVLPDHLMSDILIRLPVKALIRFKSVHPSWQALFSNKSFISEHYRRQSSSHGKIYYAIVVDYRHWRSPPKLLPVTPLTHNFDLSLPAVFFDEAVTFPDVLGPCFGIYCLLLDQHKVGLWNWSTREFKVLPLVQGKTLTGFGFGYVVGEGGLVDFKVVGFEQMCRWGEVGVYVYTLSSDSWKLVTPPSEFSDLFNIEYPPTVVNGAFHWMVCKMPDHYFIVSFDLKSEKFGTIQFSKEFSGTRILLILGLAHIDDESLCFAVNYPDRDECVEIWAMKEYGVESTWYKYMTIEHGQLSDYSYVDRLFLRGLDEDVLFCEGMNHIRSVYQRGNCYARVFRYEESLISIRRGKSESEK